MRVTFILPCVGRKPGEPYPKSWQMEPLAFAQLSAVTPRDAEIRFYDDRKEPIPFDEPTDLVAINAETYTARRAYQLAAMYRRRKIPVVLGGFHPTLAPDEAQQHADAVIVGQAESSWPILLADFAAGRMKSRYDTPRGNAWTQVFPDRSVFTGKKYGLLTLIETARGCRFDCEFCSISSFFRRQFCARPVEAVVDEIRRTNARNVFFIDDNICVEPERARRLFEALIPLKIRWTGQVSLNVAQSADLLRLMRRSGCVGVLIGFESLNPDTLRAMGKRVNGDGSAYGEYLRRFREHGLSIYGTFVFGYDGDTAESFRRTLDFVLEHRLFFAAFNHLVPFPGTPLYERLQQDNRLRYERWWLSDAYRFGEVAFRPNPLSARELEALCLEYRHKFYSLRSVLRRGMDLRANCSTPFMATLFFLQNYLSGREVALRQGLPLGEIGDDQLSVSSVDCPVVGEGVR